LKPHRISGGSAEPPAIVDLPGVERCLTAARAPKRERTSVLIKNLSVQTTTPATKKNNKRIKNPLRMSEI
jgi:hypothetical protein